MSRSLCIFVLVLGACARPLLGPEPDEGGASGESSGDDSSSGAGEDDESGATEPACHASYSPCLPVTDDLDCPDVVALGAAPVTLVGPDEYGLDADGDGIGCED